MANQSFLSVPPNVEDPVVLRRYLSRISEQLDVAFGNRGGADSAYVEQRALIESASSLSSQLATAQATLDRALQLLAQTLNEDYEDVLTQLQDLTTQLSQLSQSLTDFKNVAAIKGYIASFGVDGANNLVFSVDFNINKPASSRITTGHYRLFVTENSYSGHDVLTNSVVASAVTSASVSSFHVEATASVVPNAIDVKVYKNVINGANIERQAYDLVTSDAVNLVATLNIPGSSL